MVCQTIGRISKCGYRDSDCKGLEPLTAETLNKMNRNREHIKFAGGRVCEAEAWRA